MKLISWLAIFSIGLVSCSQLPPKPVGNLCIIDIKDNELVCAPFATLNINMSFEEFKSTPKTIIIPLGQADSYVAFSPDSYASLETYINQLESYAQKCQTSTKP